MTLSTPAEINTGYNLAKNSLGVPAGGRLQVGKGARDRRVRVEDVDASNASVDLRGVVGRGRQASARGASAREWRGHGDEWARIFKKGERKRRDRAWDHLLKCWPVFRVVVPGLAH